MDKTSITFLGAAGTVTGSKTLVQHGDTRLLVDCGLFQGLKDLRLLNWSALPVRPKDIDAALLTHAHIDHSGYIPLLVKNGFSGTIHATQGTCELCEILLPDSGFLHERDADLANRYKFSKHTPALPLYTEEDARKSLGQFRPWKMRTYENILPNIKIGFRPAGHILGAASALVEITDEKNSKKKILFSGDIGRFDDPVMVDPYPGGRVDVLVVESTYGGRSHDETSAEKIMTEAINTTSKRGGSIIIPSFAVGRAQLLMYYLMKLKDEKKIPDIPVFLDSPMAIDASELFRRNSELHHLSEGEAKRVCAVAKYVHSAEESKALNTNRMPKIIISASGMATGGRILHHLKHYIDDERNTIMFAGYQAEGTRGDKILAGAKSVKIHGRNVPVRARVLNLDMLSAHGDENEIIRWLKTFDSPPKITFINHGEESASSAMAARIKNDLGWKCHIPKYMEKISV
ncbi:MAG: MBL fold metallo-hydrolase [Rhodospirillaceae bacterium]|nr:MBL fold metallo-hydrolase [Rhodospirillaceae bacterium]